MNTGLKKLLLNTVVRIETPSQVGTGFFIYPGMLMTCAHVILEEGQVAQTIDVAIKGEKVKAKVKHFNPDPYTDVAILELDHSNNHCLQLNTGELFLGNAYFAQGFQKVDKHDFSFNRDTASLKYEGTVYEGVKELIKFKGGQIISGISGSPLIDSQGQVYGMIKATRDQHTDLGGEAIPVSKLITQLKLWNLDWLLNTSDHKYRLRHTNRKHIYRFEQLKRNIPRYILLTLIVGVLILWLMDRVEFTYGAPISVTLGIIGFLLANDQNESFQRELALFKGYTAQRIMSNLLIAGLAIITLCLWLFVGSVSIKANDLMEDKKVTLYHKYKPDDASNTYLLAPSGEVRFNKFISPAGEPFVIEIEGYDPKEINLNIGLGTKFTFPTHFRKEPALFVRIPFTYSTFPFIDSCWISLVSQQDSIGIPVSNGKGGIMFGREIIDLEDIPQQWEIDVRDLNIVQTKQKEYYDFWKSIIHRPDDIRLQSGVTYIASLHFMDGSKMASDTIMIQDEYITDRLLK